MQNVFHQFDTQGRLCLPGAEIPFADLPWHRHPAFEGVELKHIVPAEQTGGQFSFHLVRIAPNRKIGLHTHPTQLETHEVIAGSGTCVRERDTIRYAPGTVCVLPMNAAHEVVAGPDGLCLFAKFIPALR